MAIRLIARAGRRRLALAGVLAGVLFALGILLTQPARPSGVLVEPGPWGETCQVQYYTVRNAGWSPIQLERVSFTYAPGTRISLHLPERTLPPGASVRVWSGRGADDADNIYLGRSEPEWRVNGFVALLDGEKQIVSGIMTCDPAFSIPD